MKQTGRLCLAAGGTHLLLHPLLASLSPDMGPCVPSTNPPTFNLYKSHASESEDNESGEESEASSSSDYSKLL